MCWALVWLLLVIINLLGVHANGVDGLVAGYYTTRWADRVRKRNLQA
jgi:TM2 domain-containing membrane protein YozV